MKKGLTWALGMSLAVTVLGVAAHAAARDTVDLRSPLDSQGVAFQETTLGDVVADALLQSSSADLALVASDEITETSFPAGSIPPDHLVKSLRYANDPSDTVVILTLTGAQLHDVMERSVSRAPQPFDGFLQVAGLNIHYSPSQPEGKRVKLLDLGGTVIDPGHTYRVATTRPVADGSFGYFRFWSKSDVVQDTHTTIAAALTNYLATHKTINVQIGNRITAQ